MKKYLFNIMILAFCLSQGCVNYNASCAKSDQTIIGHSEVLFDLRPELLRSREAAIGNLVADSLFYAANNQAGAEANLAIIPAGIFKTTTKCGTRDFIERGVLTKGDLIDLFGEEKISLVTIEVSQTQFKKILEEAVAPLGDPLAEQEARQFLQVSAQLTFTVDCAQQAHLVAADGSEYAGMRVDNSLVAIGPKGHETTLDNWQPDTPIRLITTSDLAAGKDGYAFLSAAPVAATLTTDLLQAVEKYIAEITPITSGKLVQERINLLDNCY